MDGKRQRKSLRTRDYTHPVTESSTVASTPVPSEPHILPSTLNQGMDFIQAYNKFMYSKYDIKDAWSAKIKG